MSVNGSYYCNELVLPPRLWSHDYVCRHRQVDFAEHLLNEPYERPSPPDWFPLIACSWVDGAIENAIKPDPCNNTERINVDWYRILMSIKDYIEETILVQRQLSTITEEEYYRRYNEFKQYFESIQAYWEVKFLPPPPPGYMWVRTGGFVRQRTPLSYQEIGLRSPIYMTRMGPRATEFVIKNYVLYDCSYNASGNIAPPA